MYQVVLINFGKIDSCPLTIKPFSFQSLMTVGFKISIRPAVVDSQGQTLAGASAGAAGLVEAEAIVVVQPHHLTGIGVAGPGLASQDQHVLVVFG